MKSEAIDISGEGLEHLKTGMTLGFDDNGTIKRFRITRINRKKKKCWVVPTTLYTPEEFAEVEPYLTQKPPEGGNLQDEEA